MKTLASAALGSMTSLTVHSHQKLHERQSGRQPFIFNERWRRRASGASAEASSNASDQSVKLKLRNAELYANEQRCRRSSSQLQTGIVKTKAGESMCVVERCGRLPPLWPLQAPARAGWQGEVSDQSARKTLMKLLVGMYS